jgi:hypothetical protein
MKPPRQFHFCDQASAGMSEGFVLFSGASGSSDVELNPAASLKRGISRDRKTTVSRTRSLSVKSNRTKPVDVVCDEDGLHFHCIFLHRDHDLHLAGTIYDLLSRTTPLHCHGWTGIARFPARNRTAPPGASLVTGVTTPSHARPIDSC